jgi:hypothetical protein
MTDGAEQTVAEIELLERIFTVPDTRPLSVSLVDQHASELHPCTQGLDGSLRR